MSTSTAITQALEAAPHEDLLEALAPGVIARLRRVRDDIAIGRIEKQQANAARTNGHIVDVAVDGDIEQPLACQARSRSKSTPSASTLAPAAIKALLDRQQGAAFTAARIKNTQLPAIDIERFDDPAEGALVGRVVAGLDEVTGQSGKDQCHVGLLESSRHGAPLRAQCSPAG